MTTLSVCMIAKNEATVIETALQSAQTLADELIVVDTGSTDTTKEIALQYTPHIYDFPWTNDFSAARNYALQKATSAWILFLDADECIAPEDHQRIKELIDTKDAVAFFLTQREYTNDTTLTGFHYNATRNLHTKSFLGFVDVTHALRLFKNTPEIRFHWKIHESIASSLEKLQSKPLESGIIIHHYKNLKGSSFQQEKVQRYLKIGEEQIKETPENPKPYYEVGLIYYSLGRYKDALAAFTKVAALTPQEQRVYPRIARCWTKLGDFNKAIMMYREYLRTHKDADVFGQLGLCYLHTHDVAAAEKVFLTALKVDAGNILARHNLTLLYLQQGKKQAAIALLEESEKNYPTPFTFNILGILAVQEQNYDLARTSFEKGLALAVVGSSIYIDLKKNLEQTNKRI